jgi:hypothetical protein
VENFRGIPHESGFPDIAQQLGLTVRCFIATLGRNWSRPRVARAGFVKSTSAGTTKVVAAQLLITRGTQVSVGKSPSVMAHLAVRSRRFGRPGICRDWILLWTALSMSCDFPPATISFNCYNS